MQALISALRVRAIAGRIRLVAPYFSRRVVQKLGLTIFRSRSTIRAMCTVVTRT